MPVLHFAMKSWDLLVIESLDVVLMYNTSIDLLLPHGYISELNMLYVLLTVLAYVANELDKVLLNLLKC